MATLATSGQGSRPAGLPRPPQRDVSSRLPSKATSQLHINSSSVKPVRRVQHVESHLHDRPAMSSLPQPPKATSLRTPRIHATVILAASRSRDAHSPPAHTPSTTQPPFETPTPSLVSGSSVSSQDSPRSANVLRRKPSVIGKYVAEKHLDTSAHILGPVTVQEPEQYFDSTQLQSKSPPTANVLQPDLRLPEPDYVTEARAYPSVEIPDASTYPQKPTPVSESSTTPSMPYAASPGAFSHATTATSATSYSPMTSASPQIGPAFFTSPTKSRSRPGPVPEIPSTIRSSALSKNARPTDPLSHGFFREALAGTSPQKSRVPAAAIPASTRQSVSPTADHTGTASKPSSLPKAPLAKRRIHPPELAHLKTDAQVKPSLTPNAPSRPSRDGTSSLNEHKEATPVVTSNLTRVNSLHKRRKSSDASQSDGNVPTLPPLVRKPISAPSPTPSTASATDTTPTTRPNLTISTQQRQATSPKKSLPSPTVKSAPADSSSKTKARFGLFSRKPKAEAPVDADAPRLHRKGPTAGTGHEGYGKRTLRPRAISSSSAGSNGARSVSTNGTKSTAAKRQSSGSSSKASDLDDFLQQRLSPVYLRGDRNATDSQIRGSGSTGYDATVSTMFTSSPQTSQSSQFSADPQKHSFEANGPFGPSLHPVRSAPTSRVSTDDPRETDGVASPQSSRTRLTKPRPQPNSSKLTQSAAPSQVSLNELEARRPATANPAGHSKSPVSQPSVPTRPKKSKWNFFQRTKPQVSDEDMSVSPAREPSPLVFHKPSAHYVSSDEDERPAMEDLDRIMQEAAAAHNDYRSSMSTTFEDLGDYEVPQEALLEHSKIRESAVIPDFGMTAATEHEQDLVDEKTVPEQAAIPQQVRPAERASRLAHVGRIPKVVSTRDRTRQMPAHSFSRPFADSQSRPSLQSPPSSWSSIPKDFKLPAAIDEAGANTSKVPSTDPLPSRQFMDLGPRKNSDVSYSSSSGTMHFPTASRIAHAPGRDSDSDWPEFDDLIDHVATPSESGSASLQRNSADLQKMPVTTRRLAHPGPSSDIARVESFVAPPTSSGLSPIKTGPLQSTVRDAMALTPSPSASTFGVGIGDRDSSLSSNARNSDLRLSKTSRLSGNSPKTRRSSSVYTKPSNVSLKHKRSHSLPENKPQSPIAIEAEKEKTVATKAVSAWPTAGNMAIFRFRVLMTSKWLSFGRLLFSPIHRDLVNSLDNRILVIDGLGNRDWSHFCAETYQSAQIYSLGPAPSSVPKGRNSLGIVKDLPNHRHFSHASLEMDFPFPKGFFAAVVFRYPVAASEETMRAAVGECKRVLRPGGFLEVSSLDLDMTNMGNVARRAVRNLKMNMQAAQPDVSLAPASDQLQTLLHRRGFENINRCVVGVPTAGALSDSREGSSDGRDMDLATFEPNKASDSHITKLVAQVGRWWYMRCYELNTLPDGDINQSMWCSSELLSECEELNTTFKLLICYAQKPALAKRRTVSL